MLLSFLCSAKICGEDGMVDPNCFVIAQSVVFTILEQQWVPVYSFSRGVNTHTARFPHRHVLTQRLKCNTPPLSFYHLDIHCSGCIHLLPSFISRHFSEFLRSHHFCKYQIEVLTSGSVFLADILFCESALFYFSEVSGPSGSQNMTDFRRLITDTFLQRYYWTCFFWFLSPTNCAPHYTLVLSCCKTGSVCLFVYSRGEFYSQSSKKLRNLTKVKNKPSHNLLLMMQEWQFTPELQTSRQRLSEWSFISTSDFPCQHAHRPYSKS